MNKNIKDLILKAIATDDSFNMVNNRNIIKLYNSSSDTEKEVIDAIFINLCGYSMGNFILNKEHN